MTQVQNPLDTNFDRMSLDTPSACGDRRDLPLLGPMIPRSIATYDSNAPRPSLPSLQEQDLKKFCLTPIQMQQPLGPTGHSGTGPTRSNNPQYQDDHKPQPGGGYPGSCQDFRLRNSYHPAVNTQLGGWMSASEDGISTADSTQHDDLETTQKQSQAKRAHKDGEHDRRKQTSALLWSAGERCPRADKACFISTTNNGQQAKNEMLAGAIAWIDVLAAYLAVVCRLLEMAYKDIESLNAESANLKCSSCGHANMVPTMSTNSSRRSSLQLASQGNNLETELDFNDVLNCDVRVSPEALFGSTFPDLPRISIDRTGSSYWRGYAPMIAAWQEYVQVKADPKRGDFDLRVFSDPVASFVYPSVSCAENEDPFERDSGDGGVEMLVLSQEGSAINPPQRKKRSNDSNRAKARANGNDIRKRQVDDSGPRKRSK